MTARRTLVTGAGGFIGSHVCRALLERGDRPVALLRATTRRDRIADLVGSMDVVEADLTDETTTQAALRAAAPDTVIHMAWSMDPNLWPVADAPHLTSLESTLRVVRLATDAGLRVVCAGTGLESVPDSPPNSYVATKRGQHDVVTALAARGASVVCAHIFYLYGPWEDPRRVVPLAIASALRGEPIDLTDGLQERDMLHVTDVARGLALVAASDVTGTIDVCSGKATLLRDHFDAIGRHTARAELLNIGGRAWGIQDLPRVVGDGEPIARLGFRPAITIDDGIAGTVAWWREHLPATAATSGGRV